jgi:formamidopyrimidine-DNA glycosylase
VGRLDLDRPGPLSLTCPTFRNNVPELPEVETIRRQLATRLRGRDIVEAWGHPSPKFASAPAAIGATIESVDRRGKYLLVELDGRRHLGIHLGMTGQLSVRPGDLEPDPYARAWWALDGDERLELRDVRRFGRVAVMPRDDHSAMPTLATQGPEPFDSDFTAEHLYRELRRSKARVKTQLLSQRPVAGVGNIYADEALWAARINPGARTVTRAQATELRDEITRVLAAGIEHGGTTLRDYRDADGGRGTNQLHLECYGRAGLACHRCGTTLVRRVIDARGTTMCPACQGSRRRVDTDPVG